MTAPLVDRETAQAEVEKWLDAKKVFPSTREDNEDSIEIMIESIMYGVLTYDEENKVFTHHLMFPVSDVTTLKYKHRINDKDLQRWMKGIDPKNGDQRVTATIAALTETARGIIEGLDTMDKKVSNAIAIFFF